MRGEWAAVRAVAGFLLCLLLAGCVRGVHIVISGSVDAPVFSLSPSWILETDRTVCVRSFRVEELAASGDRGREVWSLSAQSRSCPKVRRLSYGTAPPGFDTHGAVAPSGWRPAIGSCWMGSDGSESASSNSPVRTRR